MSESEGSLTLRKTNFKEDQGKENLKVQNEIELLEVYVQQAPSMTIGERLVWHLQQQQKIISLPSLPQAGDFEMRPINAQYKDPYKILTEMHKPHLSDFQNEQSLPEFKQQQYHHLMKMRENNVGQYTKESNTVFYYDSYKVLFLLDFSKSTSNVYPFQEKSYLEKMKESITIFIYVIQIVQSKSYQNLIFRLENKYSKVKGKHAQGHPTKPTLNDKFQSSEYRSHRKSSHQEDQVLCANPLQEQDEKTIPLNTIRDEIEQRIIEDQNEQLSDTSPMRKPRKQRGLESSTFKGQRPVRNLNQLDLETEAHKISQRQESFQPIKASDDDINTRDQEDFDGNTIKLTQSDSKRDAQKKRKEVFMSSSNQQEPSYFEPQIYLTIAASGLPPSNQIRLMVHNQKVDNSTITEVLSSLESRLQLLEDILAENYNEIDHADNDHPSQQKSNGVQPKEDYLQSHLFNSFQILNLMNPNSKPLLVLMTDSTNSLLSRSQKGRLDPLIQRLHQNDTKIITIDLGEDNKVANSFGYVNHMEHLKYLAYVSRGVYFDHTQLIKLAGAFNQNSQEMMRPRLMSNSFNSRSIRKEFSKFSKQNIQKSKFSHQFGSALGAVLGGNTFTQRDHHQQKFSQNQMINYSQLNKNIGLQPDLSDNDRFHPYLNSLQKLMYSRPCSYSKFLQTSEIKELVNFEERMIFENRISGDLVKKMRKDGDLMINTSFCVRELMLNNHYLPIFRKERLSDYLVKCKNINQLCHSRSKMCFQFSKINFSKQNLDTLDQVNSKRTSRKNSSQEESGGRRNAILSSKAKKVHYHHWWSSQILILCSIQQVNSKQVHVKYKIVAQEEVIHQLRVDNGQRRPYYQENDLQFIHAQLSQENERDIQLAFSGKKPRNSDNQIVQDGQHYNEGLPAPVTLLEQLNNFIEHLKAMDKHHTLFEYLLLQADKGYEYILKRQSEVPEKYKQEDFEDVYPANVTNQAQSYQDQISNLSNQPQIRVIAGNKYSGDSQNESQSEINKGVGSNTSIPSQVKSIERQAKGETQEIPQLEKVLQNQLRDESGSLARENSSDRFKQISKWPTKQMGSDIFQNKEHLSNSYQKFGQAKHILQKTKSSDQHQFFQKTQFNSTSVPKQVKSSISEQEFQKNLFKNRGRWQKLSKIPVHQWPQLFNYRKLDLLTHSNFKFDEIINLCSQMENQYNPDYQISNMVHAIMSKLTTFSIENGLYIQIFKQPKEKDNFKEEAQIIKSSSGSGEREKVIRVRRYMPDSQEGTKEQSKERSRQRRQNSISKNKAFSQSKIIRKNMQAIKDKESLLKYGFCLVRVEWAAANLAVFHFGFYNVTYNAIQSFLQNFHTDEGNQERIEKYKKLFLNEVPDYHKERQSFSVNDYKFYEKNLSQILIPEEDQDVFNFQICSHNKSRYDSDQSTKDYGNHMNTEDEFFSHSKNPSNQKDNQQNLRIDTKLNSNVPFEEIISNFANSDTVGDRYYTQEFLNGRKKYKNSFTQQENVCYHKQWVWKNENRNTNKDFFEIIMKQRIKEGFYFLNRGCSTNKFLFIKALPAYKAKLSKTSEKSQTNKLNMSFKKENALNKQGSSNSPPPPDTYVLIQYVMYFDKDYEREHRGQSCFKTEIYMEQESAYFYFQKQPTQPCNLIGATSTINSVNSSILGQHNPTGIDFTSGSVLNSQYIDTANNKGLSTAYTSVGEKSLFNELFEYLQQVDSFLFNNVCTYHSIVKNSVQKLINSPEPPLIKGEVCYFKNLNMQQKKQRKKQKLELAIRQKMQLLKEDWNEYLLKEYPELKTNNQVKEESEFSNSVNYSLQNSRVPSEGVGKFKAENDILNFQSNIVGLNKKLLQGHHQMHQQNERIMEEASFVIQIEELLENSKLIMVEQFDVPQIIFLRKHESLKDILNKFYDQLLKVIDEFCDYKILNFSNEKLLEKFDKANIILDKDANKIRICQFNYEQQEYSKQFQCQTFQGRMSLEFFRLSKKMIKVSSKLTKNRILHFLNSNFHKEQSQSDSIIPGVNASFLKGQTPRKTTQNQSDSNMETSAQNKPKDKYDDETPDVVPLYDQEGSDDDENINQIDQLFDFILYYETSIRDGNNNLQFEPNVRTIIHNFCHFLKTNYDIIFADTVLMCLQDEIEKQQVMFGTDETKQDPVKTFEQDFKRIKPTMTKCSFRMDISFLTLLIHTLYKQGKIQSKSDAHVKFKEALDDIFYNLIRRNFQQLDIDSEFFIFKHSQKDKALVRELSTPLSSKVGPEPVNFNLQTTENYTADSVHYQIDLLGTKDSYSDSEELEGQRKLPRNDGQDISDPQVIYNSCKRLLFKVNLVIQDCEGNKVVDKQLQKVSSLFDEYGPEIEDTCKHLVEKVKFMEKEKLIAANNQEAILREMGMLYQTRSSFDNQDTQKTETQVEAQDIQSSIELYFSFYTIPSYVGLLRDQDIEYLCEEAVKENILVNDDDHEDLIRVAKLMDYLGYGTKLNSQRRLNNEEVDFEQLVRQFNKKQLVKSIPYYFKRTQHETQTFREKDYNVFFYDEIQRKIIYGILRRTYAMMAQNLLEHALLIRPIDSLNIVLAQKYLGSLLFNQRQLFRVTVMSGLGTGQKLKQAMKILKEELKMSQILNCLQVTHNGQEVFLVKSSSELKNFYLKSDLEEGNLIPFSQFGMSQTSEVETSMLSYAQNEKQSFTETGEKDTYNPNQKERTQSSNSLSKLQVHKQSSNQIEDQQKQAGYELPFWLLFQVQESTENGGEIRMNVTFHLPLYKSHSQLNSSIVEGEIKRATSIIAQRIKVIFLLQQTHENRIMPKNFQLNLRAQEHSNMGDMKSYQARGFKSYQMMTQKQTQNRLESAVKNMQMGSDHLSSPVTAHHLKTGIRQTPSNQAQEKSSINLNAPNQSSQTTSKMSGITSKFKHRMAKLQNQKGGNTTDDQSDNNQASKISLNTQSNNQHVEQMNSSQVDSSDNNLTSTQKVNSKPSQFNTQLAPPKPEIYKANLMFEHVFNIRHSSVSLEAALRQIDIQAKIYHPVSDQDNLYVTMINSKVYLMKIVGRQMIGSRKTHINQSLRSFSNPNNTFEIQNTHENHQSAQTKIVDSIGGTATQINPTFKQSTTTNQVQCCNQIIMELYGAYPVTYQNVEPLILNIDNILKKLTLNVLADNTLVAGSLSKDDLSYLEQSEDQIFLLFPIHEGIDDKYAFLRFLKQNLSRYLYQVSIKQDHIQTQATNLYHSIVEGGLKATNSMISSTQLHKQDSMSQSNIINSTILNMQGSHHPSERSNKIVLTTGALAGNGSFAGNEFFNRIHRQSSISSGEENGFLSHQSKHATLEKDEANIQITNQRQQNPIMSKSHNIEPLQEEKEDLIRLDIREDNSASLSDDVQSEGDEKSFFGTQQKIQYRQEDFLLLYNYKMPLKKLTKNNNQPSLADRQKANIINIQQIFNEALTLINFGVLKQFQDDSLPLNMKGSSQQLGSGQNITIENIMSDLQNEFEMMETEIEINDNTGKQTQILGLKYDYKSTFNCKEVERMGAKTYLPLIYKSKKQGIVQGQKLLLSNNEFGVPIPANHKQSWLMIKLNVIGELNEERFIQNLILNVNQSFNEVLIEHCVRKFFKPMSQMPYFAGFEDRRSIALNQLEQKQLQNINEKQIPKPQEKSVGDKSTFSKKIDELQSLVQQGKNLMTTIVHEFEKLIYGDPNELYLSLLFSMIIHYHQEFRLMYTKSKMLEEYMKDEYGMAVIIELIDKKSSQSSSKEKIVKTVILNISVELLPQNYNSVYKELKLHLNRTVTVLRNLQPRIKLIIGSIAFKKELFQQEEKQQHFKVRIFKDHILQLDGLRAEVIESQIAIKGFSDIISNVVVSPRQTLLNESKIVFKRNFFMVLSMYDSKVSYQSFNLEKRTFKLNTNMILNQLNWHSNRQDYFKRIVSQKLGTVFTLKDFYSSSHYVRAQGLDVDTLHKKYGITVYPYNQQQIANSSLPENDNGLKGYHGLLSTDKFTFDEKIKLIEGKQTYQFLNSRSQKSRSRRRKLRKVEIKEQIILKECQNVADEYLKSVEESQDALRFLYKSISCKTANQERKIQADDNNHPHQTQVDRDRRKKSYHDTMGMSALAHRHHMMMKSGSKLPEKKYQEDQRESKDHEIDKIRHNKKSVVPFKEFIRNKSILESILKNNIKSEIELTKILTVSPGIGPSRIDYVLCERERQLHKHSQIYNMQSSNQLISRSSFDDRVGSTSLQSDKILLNNPLYFHGVKVYRLMTGFYNRIQAGHNAAHILRDISPVDPQKEAQEIKQMALQYKHIEPGNFFYFQEQLKDLINKLILNRDKDGERNLANFIRQLIPYGRLLYSNTTMFLFEQNNYTGMNHLSNDDFKLSFDNFDDEISQKQLKKTKSKLQHLNTEIIMDSSPLLSQAFMNELKSSFFKEYCQFLIQKAGAKLSYQGIPQKDIKESKYFSNNQFSQSMNPLRPNLGKRNITHNTLHNLANSSTNSIRKVFGADGAGEFTNLPHSGKYKNKISRSKKLSEDYSSIDQAFNNDRDDNDYMNEDKILEEESNLSMIASQQEVASRHNFYKKRNFDRILFPQNNNQDQLDMDHMPRYVFKTRDDAIFVYELTYLNGLIRINVYGIFNALHLLPTQILISHTLLANPMKQGAKKKRELVDEELKLSTKLNTDSFNYDFHTRKIMEMILFPPLAKQQRKDISGKQGTLGAQGGADEVNPTVQISNLVSFYKVPPKYAKNFIDTIILRIDLGYLNKISDLEFMSYFRTKIEQYGLKCYSQKSDVNNLNFGLSSNLTNENLKLLQNRNQSIPNRQSKDQSFKETPIQGVDQQDNSQQTLAYDATKFIFYKFLQGQPPLTKIELPFTTQITNGNKSDNQDNSDKEAKSAKQNQKSNNNSQIGTGQNSGKNQAKSISSKNPNKQIQPQEQYKKLYLVEMLNDEAKATLQQQILSQAQGNGNSLAQINTQNDSNFLNNQSSRNLRATTTGNLLSGYKTDANFSIAQTQANLNLGAVSNSSNQPQVSGSGKWNNQSKKIWVMKTQKQEHSVSQINMESYEEDDNQSVSSHKGGASKTSPTQLNATGAKKPKKDEKTVIDLAFYYICVEDVNNQTLAPSSSDSKIGEPMIKKNTERYPIRALSIDMYSFINQLETAFNQARKDLIKDQLWIKFFDTTKNLQLTDIQIGDMLRFSFSYNLTHFDDRYKEVLRLKSYNLNFCSFLKSMLPHQFYKYEKYTNYSGSNRKENFLLFDPNFQNFLIHLDFNFEDREVQAYLVRKEQVKVQKPANFFQQDSMSQHQVKHQKKHEYGADVAQLNADEKSFVRKIMNLFIFWHYKQSI